MDTSALAQIQQRLAELPADVQSAVQAADLDQKVQAIGARHQLHIDQVGELGDETLLAMLGFSPLESFGRRLSSTLKLSPEAGEKLAQDVSTEIFGSIRESMKRFVEARTAQPAATPPPASKVPEKTDLHKADVILTEKTLSLPKEKPIYKADPYREAV